MPTIMDGVPRGTLVSETTNAMVRFTLDGMLDGMAEVPIVLVLAADSVFSRQNMISNILYIK
jgi:molybdopterin-guanine dinucleotide biosynthesis protein A